MTATPLHQARLTVITADDPPCITKRFWLEKDGSLDKRTIAYVTAGAMAVAAVGSLAEFARLLVELRGNQALAYGIPPTSPVQLVDGEQWAAEGRPANKLPRTRETMAWPAGPGVLMLDYDPADEVLGQEALVAAIRCAAPGLANAMMLWWPSTSSCIFNGEEQLRGIRGQRLYLLVKDASDVPRAGKALEAALWAAGFGHFMVSASGALLSRTLVDTSVWQPERPDFAAGAVCKPPLAQRRGDPVVIAGEIEFIDTATALPDPDAACEQAGRAAKAAARAAAAGEAATAREAWIEARVEAIVAGSGAGDDEAVRQRARHVAVRAAEHGELLGDWPVVVQIGGGRQEVAVGELLDNPARWHGMLTLDPLEPEYDGGRPVGKLYLLGARPRLFSFAHGGKAYRLLRQPGRTELVRGKEHDTVNAVLDHLRAAPAFFDFGDDLVVVEGGRPRSLSAEVLRHELGGLTQFWRWHQMPQGGATEVLENPPLTIARTLVGLGDRRGLRPLVAVITAPTLREDGSVLAAPGYDPSSGLLLESDELPTTVPLAPTLEQAREALARLWRPFESFPFVDPVDRGVMLAALLSAAVRPALPTCPAFGFDAPTQGSGKTLLAKCVAAIATGGAPVILPHVESRHGADEEIRKRVHALLLDGARVVLWDNVIGTFDSASLAAVLTASHVKDRVLGASRMSASVPNRALFLLSGNNLVLAGDMPRRVLRCRIDPRTETPFTRAFDLDPLAWCLAHRQALAAAALVLVRGWLSSGQDPAPGRTASFEEWDGFVRQTVCWAVRTLEFDGADPLESIQAAAAADPEAEAWHEVLVAWEAAFGSEAVTARQVLDACKGLHGRSALGEALAEFSGGRGELNAKTLGRALMYRKDRIAGGMRMARPGLKRDNAVLWRVERVKTGFAGFAGFGSSPTRGDGASPIEGGKTNPANPSNYSSTQVGVSL